MKAYTLGELLLAMSLMVFILGTALYSWRYLNQKTIALMGHLDHEIQITLLEKQLWNDLQTHPKLDPFFRQNTFALSTPLDTVYYRYTKEELYRNDHRILALPYDIRFYYRGKIASTEQIDALEILVRPKHQNPLSLFFILPLSAQNYH